MATLIGTLFSDVIGGTPSNDIILGGPGWDILLGFEGNDTVSGGDGNDLVLERTGNDVIVGGSGNDALFAGEGNDTVRGNGGDDFMFGDEGNDKLIGGAGDDLLFGGLGRDVLVGGAGADGFAFTPFTTDENSRDIVRDFDVSEDQIVLVDLTNESTVVRNGNTVLFAENEEGDKLKLAVLKGVTDPGSIDFLHLDSDDAQAVNDEVLGRWLTDDVPIFAIEGPLEVDGDDDVVVVNHAAPLEIAEGTIAFTFEADEVDSRQGLVSKDANFYEGGGNHFSAYIQDGDLRVRFQDEDSDSFLEFSGLEADEDYDVVVTFEAGKVALFVDGVEIGSNAFDMNWEHNVQDLQVGALGWGSDSGASDFDFALNGEISDLGIFGAVLTPAEVADIL